MTWNKHHLAPVVWLVRLVRLVRLVCFVCLVCPSLLHCGVFVQQKEYDTLAERTAQMEKRAAADRAEMAALRADLTASRERMENALRANAENGSEVFTSKQRINEVAGHLDEVAHGVEETKRDLAASRTELSTKLDELKKQIPAAVPPAPAVPVPLAIPQDKAAHLTALTEAKVKKDYAAVRILGPEYLNRYPRDDSADLALFMVAESDREDSRPASALGHYNRLLKLFPRSRLLDKALYGMGEAYLTMHDCGNAKLAYQSCETRFRRDKIGQDAKAKLDLITKAPPGLCAPE